MYLKPVRDVSVKLFRMLHSIIENFDSLRRLETGLEVFGLIKDVDEAGANITNQHRGVLLALEVHCARRREGA